MTDKRVTQVALEEWVQATPAQRVTQIAVEQWVTMPPPITRVTQVAIEQWLVNLSINYGYVVE
jgi:hypothetical protein